MGRGSLVYCIYGQSVFLPAMGYFADAGEQYYSYYLYGEIQQDREEFVNRVKHKKGPVDIISKKKRLRKVV